MKTWVLWILTINAQNGELIGSAPVPGYEPADIAQCMADQVGRVSDVVDGKVSIYVCHNTKSTPEPSVEV